MEGTARATLRVAVAYALPERQVVLPLEVEEGTTLGQAIRLSGILTRFPEIDPATVHVGIFGKASTPEHVLQEGDRVEIYRPLIADPKVVRQRRAAAEAAKPPPEAGG